MTLLRRSPVRITLIAGLAITAACQKAPDQGVAATTALAAAAAPPAAQAPGSVDTVSGTVTETMNSGGYTYMKLQTAKGDIWVAATQFTVKVGETLTVLLEMPMQNFHSATLNRDFPLIYFVPAVARAGETLTAAAPDAAAPMLSASHTSPAGAPVGRIATPAGGVSIADVWARRKALAGKAVTVRGQVVKVNNGIMGRNWIHLQDGTGKAADQTNDLTITTDGSAALGDIITVTGTLGVAKDFGAGYAYEAILEQATVTAR